MLLNPCEAYLFKICVPFVLPVEIEYVLEDFRVPVEEELVALDDVVVTQVQLPAVVGVCGQPAYPGLGIPGGQPVGQVVHLQRRSGDE